MLVAMRADLMCATRNLPGLHIFGLKLRAMVLADDSNMAHSVDLAKLGRNAVAVV